ncbi:DUF952 domain-containing protein [Schlesneria paludicola]|uniref:DUF952 domain-containing protein n=1 Tax=Schlesneria paludicola TaxID=360056 RepID=UPI00029AE4B5|nr:DUF952 domain-containing protein [Schlesneria paludicola]
MPILYHITTQKQATDAKAVGIYTPTEYEKDGFIHCSYVTQVAGVANRIFRGKSNLVLLKVDSSALAARVVDENLEGGTELFPHIYGELPWAAVVEVIPFAPDPDGVFRL